MMCGPKERRLIEIGSTHLYKMINYNITIGGGEGNINLLVVNVHRVHPKRVCTLVLLMLLLNSYHCICECLIIKSLWLYVVRR